MADTAELLAWARAQPRFWRYRYGTWTPTHWWEWAWPFTAEDEYGRATAVFHVPLVGFVVWAFWTYTGEEADESRAETWAMYSEPLP